MSKHSCPICGFETDDEDELDIHMADCEAMAEEDFDG